MRLTITLGRLMILVENSRMLRKLLQLPHLPNRFKHRKTKPLKRQKAKVLSEQDSLHQSTAHNSLVSPAFSGLCKKLHSTILSRQHFNQETKNTNTCAVKLTRKSNLKPTMSSLESIRPQ